MNIFFPLNSLLLSTEFELCTEIGFQRRQRYHGHKNFTPEISATTGQKVTTSRILRFYSAGTGNDRSSKAEAAVIVPSNLQRVIKLSMVCANYYRHFRGSGARFFSIICSLSIVLCGPLGQLRLRYGVQSFRLDEVIGLIFIFSLTKVTDWY